MMSKRKPKAHGALEGLNLNNLVAKHARQFNQAAVHTDRKKSTKQGYRKHKGQDYCQAA